MKIIRLVTILVAGATLMAGCGSGPRDVRTNAVEVVTPTTATSTTATTVPTAPSTTTTTVCVPADTTAERAYLETLHSSISQADGAIAEIQLVIDNGTRTRDSAAR